MTELRRLAAAAGAALTLATALVAATPAAATAADCYDEGCRGQDAYTTGCVDDAVMVSLAYVETSTGTGRVEHWHSPGCMADWATTRIYSGDTENAMAFITPAPLNYNDHINQSSTETRYDLYTYPWVVTPMIPGSVVNCTQGTVTNTGWEPYAEPACA